MPISGAIKSTFPHFHSQAIGLYMIPVFVSILLNSLFLLKRERTTFDHLCMITAAGAALHLAYTMSFGSMAPWYLTTGYLNVSLSVIWLVDFVMKRRPSLAWVEPVVGSFLFVAFFTLASLRLFSNFSYMRLTLGHVSFHGIYREPGHALAIKLRETLPLGSRIFIFDGPGIAYYSGMSILPSDGLVTNYTYIRDLGREGFAQYAAEHRIDYFITPYLQPGQTFGNYLGIGESERTGAGQLVSIVVPLTHQSAGSITLSDSDLLFRFPEINSYFETTFPEIGVWRIRH